jgi:hypothetical protein
MPSAIGRRAHGWSKVGIDSLADFFDLAGADATRTRMNTDASAMGTYCLDALHIRLGDLLAFVVRMAHFVTAEPAFAANFAFTCHECEPPYVKMIAERGLTYHKNTVFARK